MLKNKLIFITIMLVFIALSGFGQNYSDALAKAIYFYECQQAGPLPSWNRVEWRGDATMQDGVLGGLYDAGDHVKFNLPMAYTATQLAWGAYEYGSNTELNNNIKFILDYLVACSGGSYVYQVGSGSNDHAWWGPVEVIHKETQAGNRPIYSASSGLSAVMAQSAAALALGNILFGNSTYLSTAQSLYNKANSDRSDGSYSAANGYYDSWSGPIDEIMWAAIWLYVATNNSSYLANAESLVSKLNRQGQSTDIEYKWGHCWDDSHYGAMVMLAKLTGKQEYIDFVHMHLDWWASGANGTTPKGLAWLDTWGSLRYASTAAFLAFVYSDWNGADSGKASTYLTWAKKQIDYCLGNNERNGSYVIGYGTNAPQHPHHRTAHGSWADSQSVPANHRHILYGALVGGPNQSGGYTDSIGDYQSNEVACDYNAGFVSCLLKLGNSSSGAFNPPAETRDDEFFVEAKINAQGNNFIEIKALCNNRSGWPARLIKNLGFRYFMDLSEIFNAGYGVNDLTIRTNYVEFPATITINQYSGDIYYLNVVFNDGTSIYPGGQSEFAGEVQVRVSAPNDTSFWDSSNDYSYSGLSTSSEVKTARIPVYDGNSLLFGTEPNGGTATTAPTSAPTTPPTNTTVPTSAPTAPPANTTAPTSPPANLGDVNNNGVIDIVDALLIAQYYVDLNPSNFDVSRADTNCNGSVDIVDALLIAQYYVNLISQFC
ncbi:MAG: glycoside hydrolase family 9 protein [Spirochaetales bacterium]|nr:glycoside hydrolase family 9 protein [Spirochaetales bacterium]